MATAMRHPGTAGLQTGRMAPKGGPLFKLRSATARTGGAEPLARRTVPISPLSTRQVAFF
jgi:hypothetical protein